MNPMADTEYGRVYRLLEHAPLSELTRQIPDWRLIPACQHGCCEWLFLYRTNDTNAVAAAGDLLAGSLRHLNTTIMEVAGDVLADRLSIHPDYIRWQPLRLHS